jgi:hypothetical protein
VGKPDSESGHLARLASWRAGAQQAAPLPWLRGGVASQFEAELGYSGFQKFKGKTRVATIAPHSLKAVPRKRGAELRD